MKKMILLYPLIPLTFLAFGCAHHRDVRPGMNDINRVVIQTDDKEEGSRDAIEQANHFCKEKGRSPVFINEHNKYTGDMDEKTYKNAKTASKVATAAGGMAHVFGGKAESQAGGIVGLGGVIADGALGKGYTVEMKFKCK